MKNLKSVFDLLLFPFVFVLFLTGTTLFASNSPTISISPATYDICEGNGTVTINLDINISEAPDAADINVTWETVDDSATVANSNYVSSSGNVTFDVNSSTISKTIGVTVNSDTPITDDVSFTVKLTTPFDTNASQSYNIGQTSATINIIAQNTPTAVDDYFVTVVNGNLTENVLGNDGNTTYTVTFTQPPNGTVTNDGNGDFTYVPDANFTGQDIFDYNVTDGGCSTVVTATVDIHVANICGGEEIPLCSSTPFQRPVVKHTSEAYYFILPYDAVVDINITNTGSSELLYDFQETNCPDVFNSNTTSELAQGKKVDIVQQYPAGVYYFGFAGTHNDTAIDISICYDTNLSSAGSSQLFYSNIGINDANPAKSKTWYTDFPYITTKIVNKNFGLRASYLDTSGSVTEYNGTIEDGDPIALPIALYLVDKYDTKVATVPDPIIELEIPDGGSNVEMIKDVSGINYLNGDGDSTNVNNTSNVIAYASKERKYKIASIDYGSIYRSMDGLSCSQSSLENSLCKLPACLNTHDKIREVFPPAFYPHVLVCLNGDGNGTAPCTSNAYLGSCGGLKQNTTISPSEYNNDLGCFECLSDAGGGPYYSDRFSIRPNGFSLKIDNVAGSDNKPDGLYQAGVDYPIDLNATTWDSSITQSPDYDTNLTGYNPPEVIAVIGLEHNASLVCPYDDNDSQTIYFTNGYSNSNISYSNVGKTKLVIMDQNWTKVDQVGIDTDHFECIFDSSETDTSLDPLGLGRVGCMITAEKFMTFIPDHFSIEANLTDHNTNDHFTYLHDFSRSASEAAIPWDKDNYTGTIAAIFDANISARAYSSTGDGNITSNYIEKCYAKDTILIININETNITYAYPITPPALTQILYYNDINESEGNISLPAPDANGIITLTQLEFKNDTIPLFIPNAPDGNGTVHLHYRIDFDRKMNRPVNPFMVEMTDANITDTDTVTGTEEDDSNATFYFARTKPSKYLYDNEASPVNTPISVVVYNDPITSTFSLAGTPFASTTEYEWYLSTRHTSNDGNITLEALSGGSVNPADPNIVNISGGVNNSVIVTCSAGTDVNITFGPDTNNWMIYNPNINENLIPNPFYRVLCIGRSGWAGHGDTGHVVEDEPSSKNSRRLGW